MPWKSEEQEVEREKKKETISLVPIHPFSLVLSLRREKSFVLVLLLVRVLVRRLVLQKRHISLFIFPLFVPALFCVLLEALSPRSSRKEKGFTR